jgi:uncharacterized protein YdeI (YjbR/CyaY-like superfamily)
MKHTDPRVDAYIQKSAPFARPILEYLREVVHEAAPGIRETMKWSMPHFVGKGMICGMSAFKQHCAFGFWNGKQVFAGGTGKEEEAMGHFGRITKVADLPPKSAIKKYVRKAVELDAAGVKREAAKRLPKGAVKAPADLVAALKRNARAKKTFDAFAPSAQREYADWITGARRKETRAQRVAQAVEWMAAGKKRHWKYQASRA